VEYLTFRDNQFHKIGKLLAFQQKNLERKTRHLAKRLAETPLIPKPTKRQDKRKP
jgi:hypothetical protein